MDNSILKKQAEEFAKTAMIQKIKDFFAPKELKISQKYSGLSDFMLNATSKEKSKVITEAARRANEDQLKIFREAKLKV